MDISDIKTKRLQMIKDIVDRINLEEDIKYNIDELFPEEDEYESDFNLIDE